MDMSDVIKYPLSAAIELCEQLDNDETNYRLKMLEYKRERDEAREALRKAIRFVEAYEPHSRGVEVDQNETLNIIRKALEETK